MVYKSKWMPDEKIQIVLESLNTNIYASELCRKHSVGPNAFYSWREKFIQGGKLALSGSLKDPAKEKDAEIQRLKQLIAELTIANDYSKKTLVMWQPVTFSVQSRKMRPMEVSEPLVVNRTHGASNSLCESSEDNAPVLARGDCTVGLTNSWAVRHLRGLAGNLIMAEKSLLSRRLHSTRQCHGAM
ncbi:MAG: transposase [Nitrososphaerota archaeon]|nr:transposase [Nitrososphaerota archaeon]